MSDHKILETLTEIKVTLASMETDLRHHIKRSDQHEVELRGQNKTIHKLWIAVAALAGAGGTSVAPSAMSWLLKLMGV